jgi:hypothetical protein
MSTGAPSQPVRKPGSALARAGWRRRQERRVARQRAAQRVPVYVFLSQDLRRLVTERAEHFRAPQNVTLEAAIEQGLRLIKQGHLDQVRARRQRAVLPPASPSLVEETRRADG